MAALRNNLDNGPVAIAVSIMAPPPGTNVAGEDPAGHALQPMPNVSQVPKDSSNVVSKESGHLYGHCQSTQNTSTS